MKRTIVFLLTLILLLPALYSINKEKMEKWITIISEKDPQVKMQKLEEFQKEYGDKDDQLTKLMYLHLAITSFQVQKFDKTITYGEQSLTYKDVSDTDKLNLYLCLANAYFLTKTDLDKAYGFAEQAITMAKTIQSVSQSPLMATQYIAPALRIQTRILDSKGKDQKTTEEALAKASEAFKIDKSESSYKMVQTLALRLEKMGQIDQALLAYELLFQEKPSAELARAIGLIYNKKANDAKTLEFFKAAYDLQKDPKLARLLGILFNKAQDIDSALNYFAEAFILFEQAGNDPDGLTQAKQTLEHLYFNVKAKDVANQEEKERGFQELLAAARTRLGITPQPPAPPATPG